MTTHDLDDKGSRVGGRGGGDRVDGFADPVEGGEGSDGKVGHRHVVAVEISFRCP